MMKVIIIILTTISLVACSYKPIFAPNAKFNSVGQEVANEDADQCLQEADIYLKESKKRRAAKEGVRGFGSGAIFGAIFGVLTGDRSAIVKGAAIGAGAGAAVRGGGVLAEDKLTPDQIKQRYVTTCLNNKGYNIIGWE